MKTLITDYTFNAATGQVVFTSIPTPTIEQLLLIINVTDGIFLYNFADPLRGGTFTANTLTLNWNTTAMSNSDKLTIYYDQSEKDPLTENTFLMFKRLVKLMESNAVTDINNRQRIAVETISGTGLGTSVGGVAAGVPGPNVVTSYAPTTTGNSNTWQQVWIGPVDQRWQIIDAARMNYDNSIRSHLTFSQEK